MLVGMYLFKLNAQELNTVNKNTAIKKEAKRNTTKPLSVKEKKKRFLVMMEKPLNRVYAKLLKQYEQTKQLIQQNPNHAKVVALRQRYKAKDNAALLIALKPHPKSVALAQAAMESAWGTSRFFKQANNIFGVWSFNKNDKRIAASEKRGKQTIWLKKYDKIDQSIEDYYMTLSRSKAFKGFKRLNAQSDYANPYLLVKKLDRYSEKGALYGKELASMIRYNKFTRFDKRNDTKVQEKAMPVVAKANTEKASVVEVVDTVLDNEASYGDILSQIKVDAPRKSKMVLPKN
jgi:Bax protein